MNLPHVTIGFDTETHLIGPGQIIPRLVCASFAAGNIEQFPDAVLAACEGGMMPSLEGIFESTLTGESRIIIQNAAFDLTVLIRYCCDVVAGQQPGNAREAEHLRRMIFDTLDLSMDRELEMGAQGVLVSDTVLREKLYRLSTHGNIEADRNDLASLVMRYFKVDISAKKDAEADPDIWRLKYHTLDGVPIDQYPAEAYDYALSDSIWARDIWFEQEKKRQAYGYGSMNSESLQVYADTVLRLTTSHGYAINKAKVDELAQRLEAEIAPTKMLPLVAAGVLRPNGSIDTKALKERVAGAWALVNRVPMMTAGTQSSPPDIALSAEAIGELEGVDPIIDLYAHRQEFMKIVTAFLPNLRGDVVYANYDVLKETGRTSSYGGSDKRKSFYPAINGQQLPRAAGVRDCFVARPGCAQVSLDYSGLELCSVAQITYELFGYSVHRDKINQGINLHSYLGAAIAMRVEPQLVNGASDVDEAYKIFEKKRSVKIAKEDEVDENPVYFEKGRCVHFRTTAKPVGLGFPGMLGPDTFVTFAKVTYGVIVTREEAVQLREFWFATYPEMVEFKRWVGMQGRDDAYEYATGGFNRWRAGATFCATANGKSMQSLSADGAKRAGCWLGRSCYGGLPEDNPYRILEGTRILGFIHDEYMLEMADDDLLTERSLAAAKLMVDAMTICMPDVQNVVEPAAMRYWTKKAEPEWIADPDRPERLERLYGIKPDAIPGVTGGRRRLGIWTDLHK